MRYGWFEAKGSCGFNVDTQVYAKFHNNIALFAWEHGGYFTCSVTGVMSCGGDTLEQCQKSGEVAADDARNSDIDMRMSYEEFTKITNPLTFNIYVNGNLEFTKDFLDSFECRQWIINTLDISDDIRYEVAS